MHATAKLVLAAVVPAVVTLALVLLLYFLVLKDDTSRTPAVSGTYDIPVLENHLAKGFVEFPVPYAVPPTVTLLDLPVSETTGAVVSNARVDSVTEYGFTVVAENVPSPYETINVGNTHLYPELVKTTTGYALFCDNNVGGHFGDFWDQEHADPWNDSTISNYFDMSGVGDTWKKTSFAMVQTLDGNILLVGCGDNGLYRRIVTHEGAHVNPAGLLTAGDVAFTPPVAVPPFSPRRVSGLLLPDGTPAFVIATSNGFSSRLRFVRATDLPGASTPWTETLLISIVGLGHYFRNATLVIWNGKPTVGAYYVDDGTADDYYIYTCATEDGLGAWTGGAIGVAPQVWFSGDPTFAMGVLGDTLFCVGALGPGVALELFVSYRTASTPWKHVRVYHGRDFLLGDRLFEAFVQDHRLHIVVEVTTTTYHLCSSPTSLDVWTTPQVVDSAWFEIRRRYATLSNMADALLMRVDPTDGSGEFTAFYKPNPTDTPRIFHDRLVGTYQASP